MSEGPEITLVPATSADATLLENLLHLYVHDLSEAFAIDTDPAGRFAYDRLPLYWTETDRRFPFLIRRGGRAIGFALATRGSPATDDPTDLDVAEFFVLRRYRGGGAGRAAATLLWSGLPGRWVVRVSDGNRGGVSFWRDVVRAYTHGAFEELSRPGTPHAWSVFVFRSSGTKAMP
jgi:predicted acetyltransferase